MNAWGRIEEVGKKIESFTKVIQDQTETFIDFLQRLTSLVNRMTQNSGVRQIMTGFQLSKILIINEK